MKKKSKMVSFVKKNVGKENLDKLKGGIVPWICADCNDIVAPGRPCYDPCSCFPRYFEW